VRVAVLLLATLVLTSAAWLRGAEYDEQYTLFLTSGVPRPDWPGSPFPAAAVTAMQAEHASFLGIVRDLRTTDVHPPLYFWGVSLWRRVFGPSLFAARMLSVVCGMIAIGLVGTIARRCGIRPALAMLVTLGCYGFVYTSAIARAFAMTEVLTLGGVAFLLARREFLAGVCFGAACCCNYLAVFVAAAMLLIAGAWVAILAAIPFLGLDAWFFAAQHAARPGQFPPFALGPNVLRLAEYQAASIFGGLPLYVDGGWRIAVEVGLAITGVALVVSVVCARPWPEHRLVVAAAIASPIGLLLLGAVFDNTPIELRYLSFGLPFVALLAAASLPNGRRLSMRIRGAPDAASTVDSLALPALVPDKVLVTGLRPDGLAYGGRRLASSRRTLALQSVPIAGLSERTSSRFLWTAALIAFVLGLQSLGIGGLLLSARTKQPARVAATEAARLAGDAVVLLPAGNDGVGIVGAFGIEALPSCRILLIRPGDPIADRIAPYPRVALALLAQDRDSTASIAALHAILVPPNWRRVAIGSNLEIYQRGD
jgi:hypothetical protein